VSLALCPETSHAIAMSFFAMIVGHVVDILPAAA
jgi:hypothetical protein